MSALRGTIQNDILKEYSARGTYIFPVKPSMRLITDIFGFCHQNVPKWNTIPFPVIISVKLVPPLLRKLHSPLPMVLHTLKQL